VTPDKSQCVFAYVYTWRVVPLAKVNTVSLPWYTMPCVYAPSPWGPPPEFDNNGMLTMTLL